MHTIAATNTLDGAPQALSVRRLARLLDVPEATARGWLLRGLIPSLKVGGRRLVRVVDVEHLLATPAPVGRPHER